MEKPVCPKCKRSEIQFVLVGFMCCHADCKQFFVTPDATQVAVDFFVERYTGDNPENKFGMDGNLDYLKPILD